MKRNLMIYACLSVVFACQGAEEKNKEVSVDLSEPKVEREVVEEDQDEKENEADITEVSYGETHGTTTVEETPSEVQKEEVPAEVAAEPKMEVVEPETVEPVQETPAEDKAVQEVKSILITVVPDIMKFDTEVFTVAAGQKVILELDNPDGMQHNMVISKPGTLEKVGAAADALARDPKGAQKNYVPEIPEVLFATKLLEPGEVETIKFTAPTEPGDYPFVCTFPGHWRMMNGIMRVTK